jgi:hypothetical protein
MTRFTMSIVRLALLILGGELDDLLAALAGAIPRCQWFGVGIEVGDEVDADRCPCQLLSHILGLGRSRFESMWCMRWPRTLVVVRAVLFA